MQQQSLPKYDQMAKEDSIATSKYIAKLVICHRICRGEV